MRLRYLFLYVLMAVFFKSQGQVFDSPQGRGKALAHF